MDIDSLQLNASSGRKEETASKEIEHRIIDSPALKQNCNF